MIVTILLAICVFIFLSWQKEENDKNRRLRSKKGLETEEFFTTDDKLGDDRCCMYFNNDVRKVGVAFFKGGDATKYTVNDFRKTFADYSDGWGIAVDAEARKALRVTNAAGDGNYTVIDYAGDDLYKDINPPAHIEPIFKSFPVKGHNAVKVCHAVLVEEETAHIIHFYGDNTDSFNYTDDREMLLTKTESSVSVKNIHSYIFVLDNYLKRLVILFPTGEREVAAFSDILDVTYEEDGNTLYSRSAGRTVGGALAGGVLAGGVGAIVGGLSGDTKEDRTVSSMKVRILRRSADSPTIILNMNYSGEKFRLKDSSGKKAYNERLEQANEIKDLISVIISENERLSLQAPASRSAASAGMSSVVDELSRLAKLKTDGFITEEEFSRLKAKLLE